MRPSKNHMKRNDDLLGQMPGERSEKLLTTWVNIGDGAAFDKVPERIRSAARLMLSFPETFRLPRETLAEFLRLDVVEQPTMDVLEVLEIFDDRLLLVEQIRELLRRVWRSSDSRDREWLILVIRATHDRFLHSATTSSINNHWFIPPTTVRFKKDPATGEVGSYAEESEPYTFDPLTSKREARRERLKNYLRRPSNLGEIELTFDLGAELRAPAMNTFERVLHHFQRNEDRARMCAYPECGTPFFFVQRKGQRYCSPDCSDDAKREQNRRWWRENRGKERD